MNFHYRWNQFSIITPAFLSFLLLGLHVLCFNFAKPFGSLTEDLVLHLVLVRVPPCLPLLTTWRPRSSTAGIVCWVRGLGSRVDWPYIRTDHPSVDDDRSDDTHCASSHRSWVPIHRSWVTIHWSWVPVHGPWVPVHGSNVHGLPVHAHGLAIHAHRLPVHGVYSVHHRVDVHSIDTDSLDLIIVLLLLLLLVHLLGLRLFFTLRV